MCTPATAAIFFAVLTALPSKGHFDADATSSILNETVNAHKSKTLPTINILYQMLHSSLKYNETKLIENINYSSFNPIHSLHSYNNVVPDLEVRGEECCPNVNGISLKINNNISLVTEANVIFEPIDNKKNRKRRVVKVIRTDEVTKGDVSIELTTASPILNISPVVMERKKKPGETGSSAPLLNYIFDTYSNTHQHRNEKVGNGNSIYAAAAPDVEALVGSTAHLDCKVDALHDKLVSWVRRKNDEQPMELLTTGTQQYTADDRYSARFIPPDIWRLEVKDVRPSDAAHYDCQLSAHPPRTARVTLRVPEVSIAIVDGAGAVVSEQVCELGSTVALRCEVKGLRMEGGPSLLWYRKEDLLNDDTTRGGISVRTEFGQNGASSVLRVARVRGEDAGRYTCTVARAPRPAPPAAYVILHIIKGESLAELHQGGDSLLTSTHTWIIVMALWALLQLLL